MWIVWAYPHLIEHRAVRRLSTLRLLPEVDRLLYEEIAAHRAEVTGSAPPREDVLSLLLAARDEDGQGLSDEELRDHLITLLVAGHETTTTALAWCFERLLRHPAAYARLQRELEEGQEERYLDAVLNETLRVRPVIDAVWRKLSAPVEVAGHLLPAGATVMPSIELVQHSGAFADASAFRPERFLEGGVAAVHVHPLRRRRAPLRGRELRDDGDARDRAHGARAGVAARPERSQRAGEGAPHHAGARPRRARDRHGPARGAARGGSRGTPPGARVRELSLRVPRPGAVAGRLDRQLDTHRSPVVGRMR